MEEGEKFTSFKKRRTILRSIAGEVCRVFIYILNFLNCD